MSSISDPNINLSTTENLSEITSNVDTSTSTQPLDVISQSEMAALVAGLLASWSPILIKPNDNISDIKISSEDIISSLQADLKKKENEIINGMWDSFMESIAEMKKLDEKAERKRDEEKALNPEKGSAKYEQHAMAASGRWDLIASTFKQWLIDPAKSTDSIVQAGTTSPQAVLGVPFLASTLVLGSDFTRDVLGQIDATSGSQISVNPVADALAPSISPGLHPDAQSAADLVAALLYGGVKYRATVDTLQQTPNKEVPDDNKFAMNFAKNVMAIVSHNIEGDQTDTKQSLNQSANKLIRLQLLTMALNLIYRSQFGGMSGGELKGLLAGGSLGDAKDTPEGHMMHNLVAAIKDLLPEADGSVLLGLMNYVDSKQSVNSMKDSYHLLTNQLAEASRANSGRPTLA